MDCAPGMTARATRPTTKPTIMCQMMCSIGFLRLDGATVHGRVTSDHHFHAPLIMRFSRSPPYHMSSFFRDITPRAPPKIKERERVKIFHPEYIRSFRPEVMP